MLGGTRRASFRVVGRSEVDPVCDPVGGLGNHTHIVGDQNDCGVMKPLQFFNQFKDLGLNRNI